tara:strand:- start:184 stop:1977 length:1794 start_codon:yes stop_codon:yes gene_type:complete
MQLKSKFILTTLVFIIGVSSQGRFAKAQRGDFQPRNPAQLRVIQLKNSQTKQAGSSQIVVSRQPLVNPTQIQFDQTGSPIPQPPRATGLPLPKNNQLLQPMAPIKPVPIVRPRKKQLNSIPAKVKSRAGETLTIRNQLVSTEIRSPGTVNVNQSAVVQIKLKNLSSETVENVKLIAEISEHAKFISANPSPSKVEGRTYEFIIPRIGNEQSQEVVLNLVPTKKSPLKIGTQVVLENVQQTIVGVKQPELSLAIVGPQQITTGKSQKHQLKITNVGDAVATGVQIEMNYPAYLRPTQANKPSMISSIKPGASVNVSLESLALAPGNGKLEVSATSNNAKQQKTTFEIGVYEPELHLSAAGPKINFLQRGGIYSIDVENTGEVDITNLSVVVSVPVGLKVTTISRPARIEADQSVLTWNFDKLPPNSMEQIQLKAIASQEGQQICNILVISDDTVKKEFRLATQVITRADLNVGIKNQSGPVQVGSKAEFLVEVENNGSRAANDVTVNVVLPGSLVVAKDTPNYNQSNNSITFTDPTIAPGQKKIFRFSAVGEAQGDHIVRSTLQTSGSGKKLISEKSIYVYDSDETRVSEALNPVLVR